MADKTAVPYYRTSTDDKGQDIDRQSDPTQSWAAREGVKLHPAFKDEGTSGSKDPFERPVFLEAVKQARYLGATAIVVEAPDRFTRGGPAKFYVAAHRLLETEKLKLWTADQPLAQQESFVGEILTAIKAAMAKEWLDRHVQATKSGMARYKAAGGQMGQPPKKFTQEEERFVLEARDATKPPMAWKRLALELSKKRGAFDVTDDAARYRRMVSDGHVRRFYERLKSANSPNLANTPKEKVEA